METLYDTQLRMMMEGIRIDPEQRRITVAGETEPFPYQPENLRSTLSGILYRYFYNAAGRTDAPAYSAPDASLVEALSRNNRTPEAFDAPWTVETVDTSGTVYAAKGNLKRMVFAGEFVYDTSKRGPAQPGDRLRLLMHSENREGHSGYYYAFGRTPGEEGTALQTRLYFNVTPEGCLRLVDWLTATLNHRHIPFQFKCLNHPDLFERSDTAVLYLQKPYVNAVLDLLTEAYDEFQPFLRRPVPMFTLPLAPGIAFAESPPNPGESFGTSRCGLIAQGIAEAVEAGKEAGAYETAVKTVFDQVGLSTEQPYRNPRSQYPFVFPIFSAE
ncbi:T3SS effector HopA1 family protein [Larkinella soli]|uniref:T3SS effector HopA1 family protein n=1 Tax=Larkinella soli TaxID=1770527 RepID=UPI000FFBB8B3|nr:T3SS effector HopA1 family protein [Larkinella soli]